MCVFVLLVRALLSARVYVFVCVCLGIFLYARGCVYGGACSLVCLVVCMFSRVVGVCWCVRVCLCGFACACDCLLTFVM